MTIQIAHPSTVSDFKVTSRVSVDITVEHCPQNYHELVKICVNLGMFSKNPLDILCFPLQLHWLLVPYPLVQSLKDINCAKPPPVFRFDNF